MTDIILELDPHEGKFVQEKDARNQDCPRCNTPNVFTLIDRARGMICDNCVSRIVDDIYRLRHLAIEIEAIAKRLKPSDVRCVRLSRVRRLMRFVDSGVPSYCEDGCDYCFKLKHPSVDKMTTETTDSTSPTTPIDNQEESK